MEPSATRSARAARHEQSRPFGGRLGHLLGELAAGALNPAVLVVNLAPLGARPHLGLEPKRVLMTYLFVDVKVKELDEFAVVHLKSSPSFKRQLARLGYELLGAHGDAQDFGDLLVGLVLDVAQDENLAVFGAKSLHAASDPRDEFTGDRDVVRRLDFGRDDLG